MVTFVIEHLEEEFYKWCRYEYLHMKRILGKDADLLITNFTNEEMQGILPTDSRSINDLNIALERICLLDSESPDMMTPEDVKEFDYFLFGGILGNVDEFDFDRTSVLRCKGFPTRNLGNFQMTTDTAVRVAKMILIDGKSFEAIPFVDRPEFDLVEADGDEALQADEQEKLVMNFRYVKDETTGKPLICPEILLLLREDFDFSLEALE